MANDEEGLASGRWQDIPGMQMQEEEQVQGKG